MKKAKKGFTLAEIVVALVVASVVAGVTINITRQKIENTTEYFYYSAYSLLKSAVAEIIADTGQLSGDVCTQIDSKLNTISSNCAASPQTLTLRTGAVLTFAANPVPEQLETGTYTTVNIDIDGQRSGSELWTDVFPFYLTNDGKVIPAYQQEPQAGGNNPKHLSFSVKYDVFDAGVRNQTPVWLLKSVSFQQAACTAGYVSSPIYCGSFVKDAVCTEQADCRIVPIRPSPIGNS